MADDDMTKNEAEKQALDSWLNDGRYLPAFMRDFHDQKDLFKAIHEVVGNRLKTDPTHDCRDMSWRAGHVYTVDFFLWFMAKHGYTLQRSRKKLAYPDLHERVEEAVSRWRGNWRDLLSEEFAKAEGRPNG